MQYDGDDFLERDGYCKKCKFGYFHPEIKTCEHCKKRTTPRSMTSKFIRRMTKVVMKIDGLIVLNENFVSRPARYNRYLRIYEVPKVT